MPYNDGDRDRDDQMAKDVTFMVSAFDPEPKPGEPWVWNHDGLPWTPADMEDHLDRHLDAPDGLLASMKLELGLQGQAKFVDLQNLIAWLVGRKASGAGANNQMAAYETWGFGRNRYQFRMGWEVEHGAKAKDKIRPARFNGPGAVITHTVDYVGRDNLAEWIDGDGHHAKVGEFVGSVPIIGKREDSGAVSHGLHLSLGGIPFNDGETSCVGIIVNSCRVTLKYQRATD